MNFSLNIKSKVVRHLETLVFLSVWIIILIIPVLAGLNKEFDWKPLEGYWKIIVPFFFLSLTNHFLLVPFLFRKRRFFYFIAVILLLSAFNVGLHNWRRKNRQKLFTEQMMAPPYQRGLPSEHQFRPFPGDENAIDPLRKNPSNPFQSTMPPYVSTIILTLLIIGADTGISAGFGLFRSERQKQMLEKEKMTTELAFLRHQVSPHFFMNTLNNIHALIDIDTEEAKNALIGLSNLMRHLLYESNENLIPLKKEISFIKSYVDLMKIRYSDQVKIIFEQEISDESVGIPPLLFTSLIENAFKYGVSYTSDSFITINIKQLETTLDFQISNSINEKQITNNKKSSGIGLENTRKRLEILYNDSFNMQLNNTGKVFSVNLRIPL